MNKPKTGIIKADLIRESFFDSSINITETRIENKIRGRLIEIKKIMRENETPFLYDIGKQIDQLWKSVMNEINEYRNDSNDLYVFNGTEVKVRALINGETVEVVRSKYTTTDKDGNKTYCLPDIWFESGKAPYEYEYEENENVRE
jgi:hypothetical protein